MQAPRLPAHCPRMPSRLRGMPSWQKAAPSRRQTGVPSRQQREPSRQQRRREFRPKTHGRSLGRGAAGMAPEPAGPGTRRPRPGLTLLRARPELPSAKLLGALAPSLSSRAISACAWGIAGATLASPGRTASHGASFEAECAAGSGWAHPNIASGAVAKFWVVGTCADCQAVSDGAGCTMRSSTIAIARNIS